MFQTALPILGVADSTAAEAFYCGQLGFQRADVHRPDAGRADPCWMGVIRDGAHLVLSSFEGDGPPGSRGTQIFIEDADAVRREFLAAGVTCGEPFAEFVEFFSTTSAPLSVLDLGCGQGRDALMAARHGHSVRGIDIAASGVTQLQERAATEGLDVSCAAQDIETFEADRQYDVVILDRVLHMLPTEARRRSMLNRAQDWVAAGGTMLLADTKSNRALIRGCFDGDGWEPVLAKRDTFFVRKTGGAAQQSIE